VAYKSNENQINLNICIPNCFLIYVERIEKAKKLKGCKVRKENYLQILYLKNKKVESQKRNLPEVKTTADRRRAAIKTFIFESKKVI
jgi:hypothetical protein